MLKNSKLHVVSYKYYHKNVRKITELSIVSFSPFYCDNIMHETGKFINNVFSFTALVAMNFQIGPLAG